MLDPALRGFVDATDEGDAEQQLEVLLEQRVAPLVRKIVGHKLRTFSASNAIAAEDIEDVASDAILVLLQRLQALRTGAEGIESLEDYTAAAAYSACAHHLRRRHPERSRLKNQIRYLLGRHRQFGLWDVPGTGVVCGAHHWRGQDAQPAARENLAQLGRDSHRWPSAWHRPTAVDRADPSAIVADVIESVGGPVELDALVAFIGTVWQIDRARAVASERLFDNLADPGVQPEASIDQHRLAERVWQQVQELPVKQRAALLLNLRDHRGAGMLWIFPVTGVASVRAIAEALEMPVDELASLWNELPLDDNALAHRLSCTRQQVINLRMSARKRLSNRLRPTPSPGARRGDRANLTGLSASLRTDA